MSMGINETDSEFERLLIRHLSGDLNPGETAVFRDLLEEDPKKKELLEEYRKIWENMDVAREQEAFDLDAEWALFNEQLQATGPAMESQSASREKTTPGRSLLFYTYRIAAVLVAGLLFAFAWIYVTRVMGTELIAADQAPVEVVLEDGTRVSVNTDSRIRVPRRFSTSGRKVYLKGEAWFEVSRDTLRPFLVDAGGALVKVLGTRFNVNAYRGEGKVEVTVQSGMVALAAKQNEQEQIVLRAGNSGTYDMQNRELVLIQEADPNNISWKTRELYFEQTPLSEAVDLVNMVYHTRIEITNPDLATCPITVTFKNQTLESVLNVLGTTLDLDITRSGEVIRLEGPGCDE